MKSDTWLIQNISNAYQPRTDLSCQTDTLGFTTGQGSGGTGQGQIVKTHIHQKADSCTNFFQDLSTDQLLLMSGMEEMGPITKKLYDTLTGIQMGRIEAPKGWIEVIE